MNSSPRVPFGKHKGTPIDEIDPGYLTWMLKKAREVDAWSGLVDFVFSHEAAIRAAIDGPQLAKMEAAAMDLHPTAHQSAIADQVLEVLRERRMARLEGGAGYGKSYTIAALLIALRREGRPVQACAKSYVATQVLRQQLDPLGIEANTIARTLRLEKSWNGGEIDYVPGVKTDEALEEVFQAGGVLLVDEYSMVNDEIASLMIRACQCSKDGLLVVVGDIKQLPPVKQATPSVFVERVPLGGTLTIPMRYAQDSLLYQLEQQARENPWRLDLSALQGQEVQLCPSIESALDAFVASYRKNPGWTHRALFFKRRDVVGTNRWIREKLYGEQAAQEPVIEDEQLIVLGTMDYTLSDGAAQEDAVRYYSGSLYKVLHHEKAERQIIVGVAVHTIPCYQLTLDNDEVVYALFALDENSAVPETLGGYEFNAAVHAAADWAKEQVDTHGVTEGVAWSTYRYIQNTFLKIGYAYATTLHRAQGSSLDVVLVDPSTIPQWGVMNLRNALAYVGLTRASKRLIIPYQ